MTGKTTHLHPDLVALLEKIERDVGCELTITSGKRDAQTNTEVGGVVGSEHTYELAMGADVATTRSAHRFAVVRSALAHGCVRIGIGKTFTHLGVATDKPQEVLWTYY